MQTEYTAPRAALSINFHASQGLFKVASYRITTADGEPFDKPSPELVEGTLFELPVFEERPSGGLTPPEEARVLGQMRQQLQWTWNRWRLKTILPALSGSGPACAPAQA